MDILVTRRLTLRPPLEVDVDAITRELSNANVSRNLSTVPQPYTEADAKAWINRVKGERGCHFAIYRNNLFGVVSVKPGDDGYNLGYWLGEAHWGNGYASEAARAVLSYAFRRFGYDEIHSGAYEDNPASMRVLEKMGFTPTRIIQDFNAARQCDVACNKVVLSRETFERQFGPLETKTAA